ncbi:MAG: hypothetical protein ACRDMJ_12790 [Solirubrobacteraceae bacterium]
MVRLRQVRRPLAAAIAVGIAGSVVAVASAASSPTVATGTVTKITDTTAVLNGSVIPNGRATDYVFTYGPTTAYGSSTAPHSAGAGAQMRAVTQAITGLTPGTAYHYRISALSAAGSSAGADRTFTTTGHQPAAVVTGAAVDVGASAATPTGTVNPEGAATTWWIEYGLTSSYGYQTFPQALNVVSQPLSVAGRLVGLEPGTQFHYAIVAQQGSDPPSTGTDQTFFTRPAVRAVPRVRAHTTPTGGSGRPYTFTTQGIVGGAVAIPAAQRCTGNVGIRYYNGTRQVAFVLAPVGTDCRFSMAATFSRLRGPAPATLTVRVWFRGNGYVASANAENRVTAG